MPPEQPADSSDEFSDVWTSPVCEVSNEHCNVTVFEPLCMHNNQVFTFQIVEEGKKKNNGK